MIIAAGVVGLFLLFAMPLIEPLPSAALGVIIVVAAAGLINVHSIWRLRHVRPAEVALAITAFGGVLVFGVVGGVVVAIALSIGVFLYRSARPHDAVLGRSNDVDGYHDVERLGDAQTLPGLLVYRFDAPPFFVNAEYLRTRVLALADASDDLSWLVLNAEATGCGKRCSRSGTTSRSRTMPASEAFKVDGKALRVSRDLVLEDGVRGASCTPFRRRSCTSGTRWRSTLAAGPWRR